MSEKHWKETVPDGKGGVKRKHPRRLRARYPNVKDPSQLRYALLGWPPSGKNRATRRSRRSPETRGEALS